MNCSHVRNSSCATSASAFAQKSGAGVSTILPQRSEGLRRRRLAEGTTWSARTWLSFVSQRLSVATQLAAAQEVAEALGLSVAADPRLQ